MLCLGSSKAGNHDAWRSGRCDYDPASFDSWKVLKSILRVVSCSLHWEQRLSTIRRAYVNWWHEFERERTISFPLLICSGSDDSVSKLSSQRLNQDWHLEFVNEPRPGCKQTLETCWVALFPHSVEPFARAQLTLPGILQDLYTFDYLVMLRFDSDSNINRWHVIVVTVVTGLCVCRYDTSRLPQLKLDQNIAKRCGLSVCWLREWFRISPWRPFSFRQSIGMLNSTWTTFLL